MEDDQPFNIFMSLEIHVKKIYEVLALEGFTFQAARYPLDESPLSLLPPNAGFGVTTRAKSAELAGNTGPGPYIHLRIGASRGSLSAITTGVGSG